MNALIAIAALSLIPQPQSLVEKGGTTARTAIADVSDATIPAEGYRLTVDANGVTVASSDAAGSFYARETLKQLRSKDKDGRDVLPCVEITDAPQYRWRGIMIDDCRHFFGKETVKAQMDLMAMHKLNVLHWHLTDDQGWRLDIPGHPELVRYGATRPSSPKYNGKASWNAPEKELTCEQNTDRYGPFFYTEADIREILAYAAERHIKVIPEIELPGHNCALLAAHPEFACFPTNMAARTPRLSWGISKEVLCIGNDEMIRYLEGIVDYVCKVFPSDVVHIGGDECPTVRWKLCPKCQARIVTEKLDDEKGLQPWITRHFVEFLAKRGKRALGWDEYLLGDVPKSAIGMSWRVGRGGAGHVWLSPAEIVARGHDLVMTPNRFCYLDYRQGLANDPHPYIGGRSPKAAVVTLEKAYSFNPCADIPTELRNHILGGQGNNWAEYTWTRFDLEWKMWPRMCALAEVLWTGDNRPGFADFKARMKLHRTRLTDAYVNCAPLE